MFLYLLAIASVTPWRDEHPAAWIVGQCLAILSVVVGARAVSGDTGAALRWRLPPSGTTAAWAPWVGWTMAAYLVVAAASTVAVRAPGSEDRYSELTRIFLAHPWSMWVAVGLGAPLSEELLFRGVGLTVLGEGGSRTAAVTVTALLFAAVHVEIYKLFPVALLGVVFARVAWATRSILPGLLAHVGVNTIAVGLGVGLRQPAWEPATSPAGRVFWSIALAALGSLLAFQAWRATQRVEAICADVQARRDAVDNGKVDLQDNFPVDAAECLTGNLEADATHDADPREV